MTVPGADLHLAQMGGGGGDGDGIECFGERVSIGRPGDDAALQSLRGFCLIFFFFFYIIILIF